MKNGKRTLDLICKDKMQAETWFCRLESYNIQDSPSQNGLDPLKSSRCAHSCVSSWKKQNLGLPAMTIRPSQVESLERLCETRKEKIQESTKSWRTLISG